MRRQMPGGKNMGNMMKQIQKMQKDMEEAQARIEAEEFDATAGGGAIRVVVDGKRNILAVELQPEIVDPDDIPMLQDLIIAATNEALTKAETKMSSEMGKYTSGLNVPGLF